MAEISLNGRKTVKKLKAEFKAAFNATLRVYNGVKFADEDATLASIRKGDAKGGDLKVVGNMQVGSFENKVKELYGIKVQVANSDDSALVKDSLTLSQAGK